MPRNSKFATASIGVLFLMMGCADPLVGLSAEETLQAYAWCCENDELETIPNFFRGPMRDGVQTYVRNSQRFNASMNQLRMVCHARWGETWLYAWPTARQAFATNPLENLPSYEEWTEVSPGRLSCEKDVLLVKAGQRWWLEADGSPTGGILGLLFKSSMEKAYLGGAEVAYAAEIVRDVASGKIKDRIDILRRLVTLETSSPPEGEADDNRIRWYLWDDTQSQMRAAKAYERMNQHMSVRLTPENDYAYRDPTIWAQDVENSLRLDVKSQMSEEQFNTYRRSPFQCSCLVDDVVVVEETLIGLLPTLFEGEQERLSHNRLSVPMAALTPGKSHELKVRIRIYPPEAYEDTTRHLEDFTPVEDWTSKPLTIDIRPAGSRQPFFEAASHD